MTRYLSIAAIAAALFACGLSAQTNLLNEAFTTFPPTGWTVTNNSASTPPSTVVWTATTAGPATYPGSLNGSQYAICDADSGGGTGIVDSTLTSTTFNGTAATGNLFLAFSQYFQLNAAGESGTVEVFNGTTWVQVYQVTATTGDWAPNANNQVIDISAHKNAANRVRFRYTDGGNWGWWWAVDDVRVYHYTTPEIDIQRPASTSIPSGGTHVAGGSATLSFNLTFTVINQGGGTLTLTSATALAAPAPVNCSVGTITFPASLAASASGSIVVPVTVSVTGAYSFTFRVVNNDSNEGNYDINVTGSAGSPLSGAYTINSGAAASATNFTSFGSAFDLLEDLGVSGPCTFTVSAGTYTSNASYEFGLDNGVADSVPGVSATNTLTFVAAAGARPVISGSAANGSYFGGAVAASGTMVIGVPYVTLDGFNIMGGLDECLLLINDGAASANNCTVRRCQIHGSTAGPSVWAGGYPGTIDNLSFVNCMFHSSVIGLGQWNSRGLVTLFAAVNVSFEHNTFLCNLGQTSASFVSTNSCLGTINGTTPITLMRGNIFVVTQATPCPIMDVEGSALPTTANANFNIYYTTNTTAPTHQYDSTAAASSFADLASWLAAGYDAWSTAGTVGANPNLVSLTGTVDLHLTATSTNALNTATASTLTVDYDGDTRPQGAARDIGADERMGSGGGPTVTINQGASQADPTSTSPIVFDVVFSAAVTGFATGDVTLGGTAGGTLVGTVSGSGTTYTVSVSGMTTSGTVTATIGAGVCTAVSGGQPNQASTSTDNSVQWNAPAGGPTVTINQGASQADPTSTSPIVFDVVFSAAVTGFATGDVTLGGTAGGTLVGTVSGSGTTYTVSVSGMTTSGTVTATIGAGVCTAVSGGQPNQASTSTDNSVQWNAPAGGPTVTINQGASQADPTSTSPIVFDVVFSAAVTGFATGDVTLGGTAGGTLVGTVSGSGTTYTVSVSGMTTSGTVTATIGAGVCTAVSGGQPNQASTSTDNSVQWNAPAVVLTIVTTTLPNGVVGTAYNATITAQNGTGPYTWSLASGTLPTGLTLNTAATGLTTSLSGTPTAAGVFTFTVQVADSASATDTQLYNVTVTSTGGGGGGLGGGGGGCSADSDVAPWLMLGAVLAMLAVALRRRAKA